MAIQGCCISLAIGALVAGDFSSAIVMKLAAPPDIHSGMNGCMPVMARIVLSRSAMPKGGRPTMSS